MPPCRAIHVQQHMHPLLVQHEALIQRSRCAHNRLCCSFPAEEERILALWDRLDAFAEQLRRSEGKPEYIFYDGPPFATGLPHYGHILAGTLKARMLARVCCVCILTQVWLCCVCSAALPVTSAVNQIVLSVQLIFTAGCRIL